MSTEPASSGVAVLDRRSYVVAAALAFVIVAVSTLTVLQRSAEGRGPWLGVSPDTTAYLAMVKGEPSKGPFKHRLLVPALVSVLPMQPLAGFKLFTYLATFLGYCVAFLTLRALKFSLGASALSLLCLAGTLRQLVLIQNPFLTDPVSFLSLSLLVFFLVRRDALFFGITAVVGVVAREDALFLVPAFFAVGSRRKASLIVAAALAAYLIPRLLDPGTSYDFMGFRQVLRFPYWAKLFGAFGWVWLALPLGLPLLTTRSREVLAAFLFAFGGMAASTISAVDTSRVVLPLAPVVAICMAAVFSQLSGSALRWWIVPLVVGGPLMAMPNPVFPGSLQPPRQLERWYTEHAHMIVAYQALGLLFLAAAAYKAFPAWKAGVQSVFRSVPGCRYVR